MQRTIIVLVGLFTSALSVAAAVTPATFSLNTALTGANGISVSNLPAPISWSEDYLLNDDDFKSGQAIVAVNQTGGRRPQIDIQLHTDMTAVNEFVAGSFQASASSQVIYSMMIDGPATRLVPVRVSVRADIGGSVDLGENSIAYGSGSGAITILSLANWNISSRWNLTCPAGSGCVQDSGSSVIESQMFDMAPGQEYLIILNAEATSGVGRSRRTDLLSGSSDVQVLVDPLFEFVTPDDANLYNFTFSPNIVPLPPAFWLYGSALACMAAFRRRRTSTM